MNRIVRIGDELFEWGSLVAIPNVRRPACDKMDSSNTDLGNESRL